MTATHAGIEIGREDLTYVDSGPPPAAMVAASPAMLSEGGEITVEVTLTRAFDAAVAVPVEMSDPGGVVTGTLPSGGLTVPANRTRASVTLQTDDDMVAEGDAVVSFRLSENSAPAAPYTIGDPSSAMVTVRDNESASTRVLLSVSPSKVNEGGGAAQLTVTGTLDRAPRAQATAVTLSVSAGTATATTDYTAGSATLTIPAAQASATATLTLTPVADTVAEPHETVTVEGAAQGLAVRGTEVTILDDDEPEITLSFAIGNEYKTFHQYVEHVGIVPVTLRARTAGGVAPTKDFRVAVRADEGSATVGGEDYVPFSPLFTFRAADFVLEDGRYVHTVSKRELKILNDTIVEKTESFGWSIDVSTLPPWVSFAHGFGSGVVEIRNDDKNKVSITDTQVEVEESKKKLTVTFVEHGLTEFPFDVVLTALEQGKARYGSDFLRLVKVVSFQGGPNEVTVDVVIVDDKVAEDDETFVVRLVRNFLDSSIRLDPDGEPGVTITIIDDDHAPELTAEGLNARVGETKVFGTLAAWGRGR